MTPLARKKTQASKGPEQFVEPIKDVAKNKELEMDQQHANSPESVIATKSFDQAAANLAKEKAKLRMGPGLYPRHN